MTPDDMMRYIEGITKGKPVFEAVSKITDIVVFKSVIAASIDAWCVANGHSACDVIDDIADTMHEVNEQENGV